VIVLERIKKKKSSNGKKERGETGVLLQKVEEIEAPMKLDRLALPKEEASQIFHLTEVLLRCVKGRWLPREQAGGTRSWVRRF